MRDADPRAPHDLGHRDFSYRLAWLLEDTEDTRPYGVLVQELRYRLGILWTAFGTASAWTRCCWSSQFSNKLSGDVTSLCSATFKVAFYLTQVRCSTLIQVNCTQTVQSVQADRKALNSTEFGVVNTLLGRLHRMNSACLEQCGPPL